MADKHPPMDVFEGVDPAVRARTKKMLMLFIVFAIVMLFGGLTSAYIVSNMGQFWVKVIPSAALYASLVAIVLSSLTLWWGVRQARAGNAKGTQVGLLATLVLGMVFCATQYHGWNDLQDLGMGWTVSETEAGLEAHRWNNIAQMEENGATYGVDYTVTRNGEPLRYADGAFYMPDDTLLVEPITANVMHTSNQGGGYIFILIGLHALHVLLGLLYLVVNTVRAKRGSFHEGDIAQLQSLSIYWHFMGILWLYLFGFLFLAH